MTHGADAIHELVEDAGWSYPVTANRLERQYALTNVQLDEDGKYMIMVSELFLDAEVDRFESREDLERKLEPVIEAEIESRRVGIVGRLKRTFFGGR
ncbi:hypothetical protein [Halomarina pelagica]|uniref:hypothetical protein n=1 Tax=Halomarina pelagica TaxID=2961599 RepID=UPI0020C374C9|nr:hypothetical protein [Halomarina sp. BND7]